MAYRKGGRRLTTHGRGKRKLIKSGRRRLPDTDSWYISCLHLARLSNIVDRSMRALLKRNLSLVIAIVLTQMISLASAQDKSIVVASTTSTEDSGLFGHLLPIFKAKTGITVKVVAQGTGQALDTARRGDADVVLVHAKAAEEKFLAEGFGVKRFPVMYNDFILVGPKSDPAGIKGIKDIVAALTAIHNKQAPFVSRGDRSGTHQAELALWKAAGIDVTKDKGTWYRE